MKNVPHDRRAHAPEGDCFVHRQRMLRENGTIEQRYRERRERQARDA